MHREISAGTVIFRRDEGKIKFLLLYHGGGYWNFPKGKIGAGEDELRAALREAEEETGIPRKHLRVLPNFRMSHKWVYRSRGENIFKVVIFFLVVTAVGQVIISAKEHAQGYAWLLYKDARKILKHKNTLRVLEAAYRRVLEQKNH